MAAAPRLRVHNKFNSGLYGEVWDGDQPNLGNRKVAVKVIKVEMADKASAKAHALALANLNHQHIVTVHAFEEDFALPNGQNVDAIVMEWLEGETLGELINKGGMSPELVFSITDACIGAVRHMHSRGVFHGDLHGGNVIIGDSFVKVIDVSAANQRSMARYSTITKETLASVDIAYVAGNLRICLNRCTVDFRPLHKEIEKLAHVQTLEDVEGVVLALKNFDPSQYEGIGEEDEGFLKTHQLPTGDGGHRMLLAEALASRHATLSTKGTPLTRATLVKQLEEWIAQAIDQNNHLPQTTKLIDQIPQNTKILIVRGNPENVRSFIGELANMVTLVHERVEEETRYSLELLVEVIGTSKTIELAAMLASLKNVEVGELTTKKPSTF